MIWTLIIIFVIAAVIAAFVAVIIWALGFGKAMDDAWGYSLKSQRKAFKIRRPKK